MLEKGNNYPVPMNRTGTSSYKWDAMYTKFGTNDLVPLWVADMDFKAPECVQEAFREYMENVGIYGYYLPAEAYYNAIVNWEKNKHGYEIKKEWIRYSNGVVSAIYWMLQIITEPGDSCMVFTPTYYPFMEAVSNTGRKLICSELVNNSGRYTMNLADVEKKIEAENVKVFIFCSPHNPSGRVWTKEELQDFISVCEKHNVIIVSDEIHQDIIMPRHIQIPTAVASEGNAKIVTLSAGSKSFNLAGLKNSYLIIPDAEIRKRFDAFILKTQTQKGEIFGYLALTAVYTRGEEWLRNTVKVIYDNYILLKDAIEKNLPEAVVTPLEGTYLMWIDMKAYASGAELRRKVEKECGIAVDYGEWFYPSPAPRDSHIRVNLATDPEYIRLAAERLTKAFGEK